MRVDRHACQASRILTSWLLDTNILSELRRPKPEPRVLGFVASQNADLLFISIVTLAEIRFGIDSTPDLKKRSELGDWLRNTIRPFFGQRVLPISEDVMLKWRLLTEEGRKSGHTFSQPDLIIAATALVHGATLVSRNVGDFGKAGVRVVNPWLEKV